MKKYRFSHVSVLVNRCSTIDLIVNPITSNNNKLRCVVWTGDLKVFFYNPSTRSSVWERPPELFNRPDVDLLISKPPDLNKKEQKPTPTKQGIHTHMYYLI